LRVPPLSATTAASLTRLVLLTAVLSRVSVAPWLMTTEGLPTVVVETDDSAACDDAVKVVAIVMTGWGRPASGPRNVTWKIWLLAPLLARAVTATLLVPTLLSAPMAARMLAAVVPDVLLGPAVVL